MQAPPVEYRGTFRPQSRGSAMVVSGHELASGWGAEILRRGGNAADAGVAAGLVLNVVHNDMASFSGVAPVIFRDAATGTVRSLAGVGRWPAAIDLETYRSEHGDSVPFGVPSSVVPAAPDAWLTALREFGTLSFAEVSEYPRQLARDGFPVHEFMAENLRTLGESYRNLATNAAIYMPGGEFPVAGQLLVQSDLAALWERLVAAEGAGGDRAAGIDRVRDLFYRGAVAEEIVSYYREQGGLLTTADFADYRAQDEPPVTVSAWGAQVFACGPWSQGPVLPMALNILRCFDLRSMEPTSPAYVHLVVEAIKLAFSDLEGWCGDPEFVDVPIDELVSEKYGAERAGLIDRRRAFPDTPPYGDPRDGRAVAAHLVNPTEHRPVQGKLTEFDTTAVAVVDAAGNLFSATPSDGNGHGRNPIVPGLGVNVSTRGLQSKLDPDNPNCLAPRKRPRLTPNPVVAVRDGAPYLAMSCPGGNRQPQAMLQAFLLVHVFGMKPQAAVEHPRYGSYSFPATGRRSVTSEVPHEREPGLMRIEANFETSTVTGLRALGHIVETVPPWTWEMGGVCVIRRDATTGVLEGGADPRREAYAVAV